MEKTSHDEQPCQVNRNKYCCCHERCAPYTNAPPLTGTHLGKVAKCFKKNLQPKQRSTYCCRAQGYELQFFFHRLAVVEVISCESGFGWKAKANFITCCNRGFGVYKATLSALRRTTSFLDGCRIYILQGNTTEKRDVNYSLASRREHIPQRVINRD